MLDDGNYIEPLTRLVVFAAVLAALAALEVWLPRRKTTFGRKTRWSGNIGIVLLDTLLVRVVFPSAVVGAALWASARGWGLFNLTPLPAAVEVGASLILLDLLIYLQHVMFHRVQALWPFHRMHHTDLHLDATTGLRFHPVEIIISMMIKFAAVIMLGAPAAAVIAFEIILNVAAMFTHSNVRLSTRMDAVLRFFFVTPDMHRVHHSTQSRETHSNFGFNLSVWDRLFRSYRAQPIRGHDKMELGIPGYRSSKELRLMHMLIHPFLRQRDKDDPT